MIGHLYTSRRRRLPTTTCAILLLAFASPALAVGEATAPNSRSEVESPAPRAGVHNYQVVSEDSYLKVFVMRAGLLARFGHNHVIGGPVIKGEITLAEEFYGSNFRLTVAVDALEVDRPAWRTEAGAAFASQPDAKDIAGTRENMLGPKVLHAVRYPVIFVDAFELTGQPPEFVAWTRVRLKGQSFVVPIPVKLEKAGDRLVAKGEFEVRQTTFELQPFSALLGSLKVQDELRVTYRIVAEPRP